MTEEQAQLVAKVDKLNAEWHGADGERRSEIKQEYEDLIRQSDVAEAVGVRYREQQQKGRAPL